MSKSQLELNFANPNTSMRTYAYTKCKQQSRYMVAVVKTLDFSQANILRYNSRRALMIKMCMNKLRSSDEVLNML